jgi:glucose-6-phosphate isomerase
MILVDTYSNTAKEIYGEIDKKLLQAISIYKDDVYYANLKQKADEIKKKYKKVFIVGMGGSFLGSKTIVESLNLSNNLDFIYYIEDEILLPKLSSITNEDLVICISKSGQTTEVLYILEKLLEANFKNIIGITANLNGRLASICVENGFEVLKHEEVSGRFSFLTNVGILPSLIAGIDLQKFLEGVKEAINLILVKKDEDFFTHLKSQLFNKNLNLNILMPYSFKLKALTNWFCQLYAESLNKDGFTIMPYPSIGTMDQHSVLEGYLQNPEDKMITFIIKKDDSLLYKEYLLTKKICLERGMEIRSFEFFEIKEKEIGFLMTYFAIEVIFIARVLGINPFNQEMVEKRKKLKEEL